MQYQHKRVIIPVKDGWAVCPRCWKRLAPVLPTTLCRDSVVPCRACKVFWITDIKSEPERPEIAVD